MNRLEIVTASEYEEFYYEGNDEPVYEGDPVGVNWVQEILSNFIYSIIFITNSNMKKVSLAKLFEFRIKYNAGAEHVELDNYHYYNAPDAKTALSFHYEMMEKEE